jgi:N-acyl homoserine lactone hydrolase
MGGLQLTAVDAGPFRLERSKLVPFAQGMVSIPTTVGIIQHPKHGLVLWDTGVNHVVADPEAAEKYWAPGVREAFGAQGFTREHAIDKQLEKLGFKTNDVRYVIYSHLHIDHAGGMCYFPNAVHVVQSDEIRYAMWPDAWQRPTYCQNDFAGIRNMNMMEVDGDIDLFNDGSLRLLKTPGHSPGHQALLLNLLHRGQVCLGADVGHQRDGFANMMPMPWDWSLGAMSLSRMRVKQLVRDGVPVFLCHEAQDFADLPQNGKLWD